jgi:hypothetical protein
MKKSKIIASAMSLALVFMMGTTAFAATDTQASVGFVAGELTLVSAPNFNFKNDHEIPTATVTYDLYTGGNTLKVTDATGAHAGWNVTAALSKFKGADTTEMNGASILLNGATITAGTGTVSTAPTAPNATLSDDATAAKVFVAADGAGEGEWNAVWSGAQAQLKLEDVGSITPQNYTATLDWVITAAP